ncbi:MAG: serine hydrolase domain-containing protein [Sulfitobacter sp.]|uniref:serine hydrolase domain-containing protein n=1 Tax=Alphaproteobacteria TaxID=28211 RepID=UPI00329923A1
MALAILALLSCLSWGKPLVAEPAFVRLAIEERAVYVESSDADTGPETPFAIASIGKTFTAVAILRLVERGALSLEAQVTDLVSAQIAADLHGLPGMRLHHLLSMTSGLPDYYTDAWLHDALEEPDRFQTATVALRHAAREAPLFRPGSAFDYSNTNYLLLGLILERVTGKSYADVMHEEVLAPAGLSDSFVFGSRPLPEIFARGHPDRELIRQYYSGHGFGDGGIISTARDVVSFYVALLGLRQLLSEPSLLKLQADPLGAAYGMGLEVEGSIVGHAGGDIGYSSDVRMDLETGDIAVYLIASEGADTSWPRDRLTRE